MLQGLTRKGLSQTTRKNIKDFIRNSANRKNIQLQHISSWQDTENLGLYVKELYIVKYSKWKIVDPDTNKELYFNHTDSIQRYC